MIQRLLLHLTCGHTGAPYMVLTAHWVNSEWNLQHAVIAF